MPSLHQCVWRHVVLPSSNNLIPFSIACMIWFLDSWNNLSNAVAQLISYVHETWLTSPNHDLALVISVGTGKSFIAERIEAESLITSGITHNPAKFAVKEQSCNFEALATIPLLASKVSLQ